MSAVMSPEDTPAQQELTHILVTELLAHQFCFPVQWIKTQEVILREFKTKRLIEIGPAPILGNMIKKSLSDDTYKTHDVVHGLKREILSSEKNTDEIHYRHHSAEENETSTAEKLEISSSPIVAPPPPPVPQSTQSSRPVAVPDQPVTPLDILMLVTSSALKRQPGEIQHDQSIKELCGGRSTVQNEIIGDLTREFGSLPEQPEELPLSDLGRTLADSGLGLKLGPLTSGLIGKLVSSKMPPGQKITDMRQYLQTRWGFGSGLQDRALLAAIPGPPDNRLTSATDVNMLMDKLATEVMQDIPNTLSPPGVAEAATGKLVGIPEDILHTLRDEQQLMDKKLLDLYAKRLGQNPNAGELEIKQAQGIISDLQLKVDAWSTEHGETYKRGIEPRFDARKARVYDSYWNWVLQDLVISFNKALSGRPEQIQGQLQKGTLHFGTRLTSQHTEVITHLLGSLEDIANLPSKDITRKWLLELRGEALAAHKSRQIPSFRYSLSPTIPILEMDEKGHTKVVERPRPRSVIQIASSVASSDDKSEPSTESYESSNSSERISTKLSSYASPVTDSLLDLSVTDPGNPQGSLYSDDNDSQWTPIVETKGRNGWHRNDELTKGYLQWFARASVNGVSFHDQTILITGAGKNSIGSEIAALALAAGAKVLVTTSSYSKATLNYYQAMYRDYGSRSSSLVVVPFNGGSYQDILSLVQYIYIDVTKGGLGWDLDKVVPFAAMPEGGRTIDQIDDQSELAHRVMLTNLVRLLGAIKVQKSERGITSHPTHILLPLSPNHGSFGRDGLYAESKIGLEAILNKWWSEDWGDYLTLCGVMIGWTRSTRLMGHNDVLATGLEKDLGIQTFTATEMAWHIIGLLDARLSSSCDFEPIKVDLTGGLSPFVHLKPILNQIKQDIQSQSDIQIARYEESLDEGNEAAMSASRTVSRKARLRVDEMVTPEYAEFQSLTDQLDGMVDLDRVVVVVGFGEAGPCGSSRTRWEAESAGTFSIDGALELAWMMGLVKYHNGKDQGQDYCGWIDIETQKPIADADIKAKYEHYIIDHTGIRIVERKEHDLAPHNQQKTLYEVAITEDLEPIHVSVEMAKELKREHGGKVIIHETGEDQVPVTIKAGTTIFVPKAAEFPHAIGAQMPTGWDARVYGISEDVISQVDPVTLYTLVATVEAFLSAGITDPYELYDFIHVSDVGNAIGSGLGGQKSLQGMFKQRFLDRQVQKDVLAETFINTTAAWVNMLLCGSSGPIRTPVGACATSLESIDTGYDLIKTGKAKVVLVGGADTLEREIAQEFANMKATINVHDDAAAGRTPKEASRPMTTTRGGFVEGEGCGIQILATARLALDMGLPIRAIIALSHTASDQIGRSVPAPGKGLLTIAGEKPAKYPSPLLNIGYRRRQLRHCQRQIDEKRDLELNWLNETISAGAREQSLDDGYEGLSDYEKHYRNQVNDDAERAYRDAQNTHGNEFWRDDPSISPLRGALAVWGLTVDDISVASLHGTSTVKNDLNETEVIQRQLEQLGRKKGNVLPCVVQKSILGHGKGAAGAFAVNGSLQILHTGIVPGNRNADNIDSKLQSRDLLFFPSRTYQSTTPIKAFSVTSFGFGQKGAQVIGVNSRYLFATLSQDQYDVYRAKVQGREERANSALQEGIYSGQLVQLKKRNFYEDADLEAHLLERRS